MQIEKEKEQLQQERNNLMATTIIPVSTLEQAREPISIEEITKAASQVSLKDEEIKKLKERNNQIDKEIKTLEEKITRQKLKLTGQI